GLLQGTSNALVYPLIVGRPPRVMIPQISGLTTGVVFAGSSIGGAVSCSIFRQMLTSVGLKKSFAILLAAWFMISERRKPTERKKIIWVDSSFFSDPVFRSLGICLFLTVFGYLSPIYFLPTFTKDKLPHISEIVPTLPLTMLNFSGAAGRTNIGFLVDRIGPVNSLWLVVMLSGLTQLLVWIFVSTYAGIMAFAILYGLVCCCSLSLSPAVAAQLWGSAAAQ
ncbi:major facilitator superfamily domain-containing protein, partial [Trametes elegans]